MHVLSANTFFCPVVSEAWTRLKGYKKVDPKRKNLIYLKIEKKKKKRFTLHSVFFPPNKSREINNDVEKSKIGINICYLISSSGSSNYSTTASSLQTQNSKFKIQNSKKKNKKMGFFMGLILGIAVGLAIIVGLVKSENARSKRRSELATIIAAFSKMTVEDSRKIFTPESYPSWLVFSQRQKLSLFSLFTLSNNDRIDYI